MLKCTNVDLDWEDDFLCVFLMHERRLGASSQWAPWMATQPDDFPHTVCTEIYTNTVPPYSKYMANAVKMALAIGVLVREGTR